MYAELTALDGARAGEVRLVRKDFATIGRHPSAEIGLDPERDLDASGRHAAVFRQGAHWVLRDLGSTNGTFVNDVRIKHDRVLVPGDVIALGPKGPRLRFTVGAAVPAAEPAASARAPNPVVAIPYRGRTAERVRARVRKQTVAWRVVTVLSVIALVVTGAAVGGFAWRARALERERDALLRRLDSVTSRLDATTSGASALNVALGEAKADAARLRESIATGNASAGRLAALSQELSVSLGRHRGVLRAAELDAAAVARAHADAIALIVSELPDRRRVSGTGLTVRARGDTGWILTSRHLVVDSTGASALRLGAIYHRTAQNFRAHVVAVSDSADLALLAVHVRGGVPEAPELGTGTAAGDAVAILGYPFGFDFPTGGDWRTVGVSAATFSGTVTRVTTETLEIDGYGATGSSGSPVFDAAGAVVGIVFGGNRESQGRVLYAVPVGVVRAFLTQHGL